MKCYFITAHTDMCHLYSKYMRVLVHFCLCVCVRIGSGHDSILFDNIFEHDDQFNIDCYTANEILIKFLVHIAMWM